MFITLGSGAFSPCWRRSCNYNAISEFMTSCTQLYLSNKHDISLGYSSDITVPPAINFDVCLHWDASKESELAYFKPPPKYPCRDNLIDGKCLKGRKITFKGLTNAWKITHEELVSGIWEKKHAVSYLSVETVNKKAIEALIENSMN
jgi:hypothetical protein